MKFTLRKDKLWNLVLNFMIHRKIPNPDIKIYIQISQSKHHILYFCLLFTSLWQYDICMMHHPRSREITKSFIYSSYLIWHIVAKVTSYCIITSSSRFCYVNSKILCDFSNSTINAWISNHEHCRLLGRNNEGTHSSSIWG